jgi:hypothetical protein
MSVYDLFQYIILATWECLIGIGLIFGLFLGATVRGGRLIADIVTDESNK